MDFNKNYHILYEPHQRIKIGFFKTFLVVLSNIYQSRELIWQLFKRDFFMAYKKSFFGIWWQFISPIFGIIVWVFYNSTGILNPGDVGIPYPAYVLLSMSIWSLFMSFYTGSQSTLDAGGGFINQVNYPHEVLMIKQVMISMATFLISFVLNFVVLIGFGVIPSWLTIFFPILVLPLFFIGASIGLISALVKVVVPDLQKGIDFIMTLLYFCTPVIYSSKIDNQFIQIVTKYNPLTYLFEGVRGVIIYGKIEHWHMYIYAVIASFLLFLISLRIFYISEQKVIERMI
ncbi:MAG: ABC transporter permease [Bacteroidota bacterium]